MNYTNTNYFSNLHSIRVTNRYTVENLKKRKKEKMKKGILQITLAAGLLALSVQAMSHNAIADNSGEKFVCKNGALPGITVTQAHLKIGDYESTYNCN